jgi:REP element-mobilizing transposase RayT
MTTLKTRPRISPRLAGYDYRNNGAYFITIVTMNRVCLFEDPRIVRALTEEWARSACAGTTPPPYEFVVMPNHVHGIVWLSRKRGAGARHEGIPASARTNEREPDPSVAPPTRGASPLRGGCVAGSLSAIVGAFKSAATKRVRHLLEAPQLAIWQPGYYERVVRNERSLERIRGYILDNPRRWAEDPHHPASAA